jgi:hypothetical protein
MVAQFVLGDLGERFHVGNCNFNEDGVLMQHINGIF